jgi:hypothetical protein
MIGSQNFFAQEIEKEGILFNLEYDSYIKSNDLLKNIIKLHQTNISNLVYLNTDYLNGYGLIGGPTTYFEDLIKYKIGLSIAGRGELCYRDIEYMALGIPMIRFNYLSELNPNLIPNYHYISINRPDDLIIDRLGNESHAKLIEERYLEVKDDYEFLNFISKNARQYYTDYLSRENRVNHTIKLLNL